MCDVTYQWSLHYLTLCSPYSQLLNHLLCVATSVFRLVTGWCRQYWTYLNSKRRKVIKQRLWTPPPPVDNDYELHPHLLTMTMNSTPTVWQCLWTPPPPVDNDYELHPHLLTMDWCTNCTACWCTPQANFQQITHTTKYYIKLSPFFERLNLFGPMQELYPHPPTSPSL